MLCGPGPSGHGHLTDAGAFERARFADLDRLLAADPHNELAVQWYVAVEFGILMVADNSA
jgi:hypothetical protein